MNHFAFHVLRTDVRFPSSPASGAPDCLCSRCGIPIAESSTPIVRVREHEAGRGATFLGEFRYCPTCVEKLQRVEQP
jgi:hypothetical protein